MRFNEKQLALMGVLIAFNVAIGGLVHIIKLPVFLDAIGTILTVLLVGPIAGALVGIVSFLIASALISPVYAWFIGTQAVIAIAVYMLASKFKAFKSFWRVITSGILLGIIAGIVSAPVIVLIFGGVSGSGRDLITATLVGSGQQVFKAVLMSGAASEPVDKTMQILFAYIVLRSMPKKILRQFDNRLLRINNLL
jgi:energy-coupling factor transport system substrate-specific component